MHAARDLLAGSDEIPYTVRRSARARRVRVNVHAHAGVEVVLPVRVPEREAAAAVVELRPWIERRLAEAREAMAPRLDRASGRAGLAYSGLDIRGQRTRWASCSARGRMSFNWRLLLAPERVLEYVVWHEVCHLAVLDHSPRFWALLGRHWPSWREERAWLSA